MGLAIGRGKRAFIAGMTGSGKTRAGLFLLQHLQDYPVYILDTKIEDAFKQVLGVGKNGLAEIVDSIANYDPIKAKKPFVILRPDSQEAQDPELIDRVIYRIHDRVEGCGVYIDEAYQVHINGRAGPGLTGLLTRGRSRKQTAIISTQRPAWISRFCTTEADKFYIFRLGDKRDRQTLLQIIPDEMILQIPPKYHFIHYDTGDLNAQLYSTLPLDAGEGTRADLAGLMDGLPLASSRRARKISLL